MSRTESFQRRWASDPVPGQFESPPNAIMDLGWQGGAQAQLPEAKWENWWHHRVDEALHEIEENGAPEWFNDVPYKVGALAHAGGKNWVAVIANSNISPTGPDNTGQWKEVVVDVMAAISLAAPPTMIGYFFRSTAPAGWLKANGEAIAIATYPALAEAMYVGDERNATAPSGYRCTDPANPSGTRSTTGAYIVKPEIRGEFIRGVDDGRGVDPGRLVGSTQKGSLIAFDPTVAAPAVAGLHTTGADASIRADLGVDTPQGADYPNANVVTDPASSTYSVSAAAGVARPRSVAFLACIKY
ncbi:MAG: tail fiber protein [Gammaproteobacteria bacterium]|uniref:Putative tail collar protein n=1 Tax=viral metagenome TaxID=1070528 RepID=A0A6M3M171_9ZZZZ|nr:tail fiber protein [Gammaproteobacteria bacterium]